MCGKCLSRPKKRKLLTQYINMEIIIWESTKRKFAEMDESLFKTGKCRWFIKSKVSDWCNITNEAPQGLVLSAVMFLIYINDITKGIKSSINLFADSIKLLSSLENKED